MLELARRFQSGEPVRIRSIAERHGIPSQFLVQILLQLKQAGLVASTRGAGGGYRLAQTPEEVTLADVVGVVEGQGLGGENAPRSELAPVLAKAFYRAAEAEWQALSAFSLADLAQQAAEPGAAMYYI